MMREAVDATILGAAPPSVVEVSWSQPETACVLHGEHCWHVQFVTGIGQTRIVKGTRCCCWCGVRQTAHHDEDLERHGCLRLPSPSLLDLVLEAEAATW